MGVEAEVRQRRADIWQSKLAPQEYETKICSLGVVRLSGRVGSVTIQTASESKNSRLSTTLLNYRQQPSAFILKASHHDVPASHVVPPVRMSKRMYRMGMSKNFVTCETDTTALT